MKRFRSLALDRSNIRIAGLRILSFAVHGHLSGRESVEPHRHAWAQVLVYLRGTGNQTVGGRRIAVQPGTLIVLPPGVEHAFCRTGRWLPLCLMIDFQLPGSRLRSPAAGRLAGSELTELRQRVAQLSRRKARADRLRRWDAALVILKLLVNLLRRAGWVEGPAAKAAGPASAVAALLAGMVPCEPLAEVIRRSGYQRDHLNRLCKRETGLTLGQHRARRRLAEAKVLLGRGMRVGEVAAAVGVDDPNYFARWFRRQTGSRPSEWTGRGGPDRYGPWE